MCQSKLWKRTCGVVQCRPLMLAYTQHVNRKKLVTNEFMAKSMLVRDDFIYLVIENASKKQKHRIVTGHHSKRKPDCSEANAVPSLTLRSALSATPFVCGLWGVQGSCINSASTIVLLSSAELTVYTNFGLKVTPKSNWEHQATSFVNLITQP